MMNNPVIEELRKAAAELHIDIGTDELAAFFSENNMSEENITTILHTFEYLRARQNEKAVNTLLKLSRLPLKNPKTFENFDYDYVHGKEVSALKNLQTLTPLYQHKNLAFIGPAGTGKTHTAQAFGRKCCESGYKTYFLKATELNERLTKARRMDKVSSAINGLIRPSCLIIDEIGNCNFDRENTRLFFDIVDRRSEKEGANCMIFTSNQTPDKWSSSFTEQESLLCALDRIFDDAIVFMFKGQSYRGREMKQVDLRTGGITATKD